MRLIPSCILKFLRGEDGPTSVEYAVLLALILTVCVSAVQLLGRNARGEYREVARTLQNANP